MKKILVPFDFSVQAIDAFKFAHNLDSESKAKIHVLFVVELPIMYDTVLMPALSFEKDKLEEARSKAEKKLSDTIDRYAHGLDIVSCVELGQTTPAILQYIEKNQIDLVVMGTKGASGMKEMLIGSNTEKIVRASTVPVITVKSYVRPRKIKNIVFPNTLSTDSNDELVDRVMRFQKSLDATIHIVWINTPLNFAQDIVTRKSLQDFASRYGLKNFTINIFNDVSEETGIINFTHMIGADLIALGTHGRTGLAHLITGSLAENLVNHVDCPVWTYTIKSES